MRAFIICFRRAGSWGCAMWRRLAWWRRYTRPCSMPGPYITGAASQTSEEWHALYLPAASSCMQEEISVNWSQTSFAPALHAMCFVMQRSLRHAAHICWDSDTFPSASPLLSSKKPSSPVVTCHERAMSGGNAILEKQHHARPFCASFKHWVLTCIGNDMHCKVISMKLCLLSLKRRTHQMIGIHSLYEGRKVAKECCDCSRAAGSRL